MADQRALGMRQYRREARSGESNRALTGRRLVLAGGTEIAAVAAEFGLHPLAVEDTISAHQRPKLGRHDDVTFVVTVRHAAQPDLAEVRRRLKNDPHAPLRSRQDWRPGR